MQIIKLRAWDGINKKFSYWTMNNLCTWDSKDEKPSALDDWELFTGMQDKNGKDVYDGDIVLAPQYQPRRMVVKFVEGAFCCDWGDANYPIDINHFYPSSGCCFEVIGNIHENEYLRLGKKNNKK